MAEGSSGVTFTVALVTPYVGPYQGYFFSHFAFQAFITSLLLPFYAILFYFILF
jgi:hypothetical protein